HIGLEGTQQISTILVHPRDPNTVLVAALGGFSQTQSDARGVFRSTDGGANRVKTPYGDDKAGSGALARAAAAPDVILAATMFRSVAPGTGVLFQSPDTAQTRTRLYKSIDGGLTWHEVSGGGLPRLTGRISLAIAVGTNAQRLYLIGNFGLYRSDDGGTSWRQMAADDKRIANGQGGYTSGVYVDSKNPDIVYTFHVTATTTAARAIATRSRGDLGTITPIDSKPVPAWEWGTILPDPSNANVVYSSGLSIAKITYPGGEWINVGPEQDPSLKLRASLNLP